MPTSQNKGNFPLLTIEKYIANRQYITYYTTEKEMFEMELKEWREKIAQARKEMRCDEEHCSGCPYLEYPFHTCSLPESIYSGE